MVKGLLECADLEHELEYTMDIMRTMQVTSRREALQRETETFPIVFLGKGGSG